MKQNGKGLPNFSVRIPVWLKEALHRRAQVQSEYSERLVPVSEVARDLLIRGLELTDIMNHRAEQQSASSHYDGAMSQRAISPIEEDVIPEIDDRFRRGTGIERAFTRLFDELTVQETRGQRAETSYLFALIGQTLTELLSTLVRLQSAETRPVAPHPVPLSRHDTLETPELFSTSGDERTSVHDGAGNHWIGPDLDAFRSWSDE